LLLYWYRGGVVTPPLPKPQFVLTDTSGAAFDFRQRTDGYVTLLFFGYTNCPDQCPMHMATLGAALKKLPPGTSEQVKLNLAHVIYPGGVSKADWVHDLPLLIQETWMRRPE
jgi:hypothetical protein